MYEAPHTAGVFPSSLATVAITSLARVRSSVALFGGSMPASAAADTVATQVWKSLAVTSAAVGLPQVVVHVMRVHRLDRAPSRPSS
jgi:hypothetical protein